MDVLLTRAVPTYRWTLGSILFITSFAAMMGPWAYFKHLTSGPRLPFTSAYFGSLVLTMYFALSVSLPWPLSQRMPVG